MEITQPTADFVTTTLSGVLAVAATTCTVGTGLSLPATNGVIQISYDTTNAVGATDGPETVHYTAYDSGTGAITGMTRGVAGTTDVEHSNGQSVQLGYSTYYINQPSVSYTPSWTSAVGTPSIGNGTITGKVSKDGRFADVNVYLVAGSTTTAGTSGNYRISLPYALVNNTGHIALGTGILTNASTSDFPVICYVAAGETTVQVILASVDNSYWGVGTPFAFADGDSLKFNIRMEASV